MLTKERKKEKNINCKENQLAKKTSALDSN